MNTEEKRKSNPGVWITQCRASCGSCGTVTEFEFPLYVHDESWPEFREMVINEEIQFPVCSKCNNSLDNPFVFDSAHYGALVFIAGQGDHKDIQNNFERFFGIAVKNLSAEIADDAKKKPYCIVNGWYGFKTLLECLHNIAPKSDQVNGSISEKEGFFISKATGYIYGNLFFYYPDQVVIEEIAKGFMQIARNHRMHDRLDLAYDVLKEGVNVIGETHQWLVQELGAAALEAEDFKTARYWLNKAVSLQHKWLAPTLSFFDATPIKRADGETQDKSLPHAEPMSRRGKLIDNRHVVTRHFPPSSDYNLWYFPILQDYVIPPEHLQINRRLVSYAIVIGEFMYSLELHEGATIDIMGAYHSIVEEYIDYMKQIERNNISVPEELSKTFWLEYVIRRWRIPRNYIEISKKNDIEAMCELSKLIGNLMGIIGKDVKKLRAHDNSSVEVCFLEHSLNALLKLVEHFINKCPPEKQNELMTLRLQAEVDALSDTPGQWTISMSNEVV